MGERTLAGLKQLNAEERREKNLRDKEEYRRLEHERPGPDPELKAKLQAANPFYRRLTDNEVKHGRKKANVKERKDDKKSSKPGRESPW